MDWMLLWTITLWVLAWYPCCCGAMLGCNNCETGTTPPSIIVDLYEVADGICGCSALQGSYECVPDESDPCVWRWSGEVTLTGTDSYCGTHYLDWQVRADLSGEKYRWRLDMFVGTTPGSGNRVWWSWFSDFQYDPVNCAVGWTANDEYASSGSILCNYPYTLNPTTDMTPQ